MENEGILPSLKAQTEPQIKIVKADEVVAVLTQLFEALSSANTTLVQCRAFITNNLDNLKAEPSTQENSNV
jgi:hypothetical protein